MYTTILALCMAVLYFFSFFFLFFPIYIPCTVLYYCSFCRVILLNVSSGFNLSAQVYIIIITYKQFVKKFSSIAFLYFIEKCNKVVFQKNKKLSLRRLTIQYFFFLFFFFFFLILFYYFIHPPFTHIPLLATHQPTKGPSPLLLQPYTTTKSDAYWHISTFSLLSVQVVVTASTMDHPPSAPPLHNQQQQQQQKIASSALKPHLKVEREILPKPSSLTSLNASPSTTSSTTNPQPTKKRPITMVSGSGAHVAKRNLAPSASPDLHSSDKHSDSLFKSITTDILPKPLPNAPVASLSSPTIINSVTSTTANGTAKTTIGKASNSSKGTTNKVGQKKPLAPTAPTITKKKPSKSKYISKKAALVMKDQKDATSSLASSSNSPTSITKNETLPNTDNNIANSNHHLVNYSRPSPPPLSSHISHDFADSPSNPYRPRPVRSCTHCRQQKIRCNALETFPAPCTRCSKMDRKCVVDPFFKPQKGGQVQSLRDDISSLKQQLAALQRKNSTFSSDMESSVSPTAAHDSGPGTVGSGISEELTDRQQHVNSSHLHDNMFNVSAHQRSIANLIGTDAKSTRSSDYSSASTSPSSSTTGSTTVHNASIEAQNYSPNIDSNSRVLFGDSLPNKQQILHLHKKKQQQQQSPHQPKNHFSEPMISQSTPPIASHEGAETARSPSSYIDTNRPGDKIPEDHIHSRQTSTAAASPGNSDYIMGDVRLPFDKAEELHKRFMTQYLPFLPIIQSNSAAELYRQSQLLFWTVCLTASLSEPVPDLYNSLCSLIKQLAIETCWIQTPRSTHIVQALLILGNWPLPNEKVLDDCSYRFITLAKSLAMQLGLHRGKFIYEFSRTQVSLPDAEKWRTRTWIAIFIAEQVWCANLGLPPNMPMDYLLEESRTDASLPKPFRSLACLAIFCSKLVNLLGASVTSPDGTLEPKNRFSTLGILEQELDRLVAEMGTEDGKYYSTPT